LVISDITSSGNNLRGTNNMETRKHIIFSEEGKEEEKKQEGTDFTTPHF